MDKLSIKFLGSISILAGDRVLDDALSSKSIAIIAMLINSYPNNVSRNKIAETLWADNYGGAGYNLRYNLWNIKKIIPLDYEGNELIVSNKDFCAINPLYKFESDVNELKGLDKNSIAELDMDKLKYIKKISKGEFLEGFHIKDAEEFYEWILINRVKYQKLYLEILRQLAKKLQQRRSYKELIEILEEILVVSPYDEDVHYQIMEAYVKEGEDYKAIAQYKKCDAVLRSELNIGPEQRLKDLYLGLINNRDTKLSKLESVSIIKLNERAYKIEYSALSQLIEQLKTLIHKNKDQEKIKPYKNYMSLIDPSLGSFKGTLLDITLFLSIKEVLKVLGEQNKINIIVYNKEKLDYKSKQGLEYLSHELHLSNVSFIFEK